MPHEKPTGDSNSLQNRKQSDFWAVMLTNSSNRRGSRGVKIRRPNCQSDRYQNVTHLGLIN